MEEKRTCELHGDDLGWCCSECQELLVELCERAQELIEEVVERGADGVWREIAQIWLREFGEFQGEE